MVKWTIVYTKQAQKDAKRLSASGLRGNAERLLNILATDPFQVPPPYESLVGNLRGRFPAASTSSIGLSIRSCGRSES